MKQLLSVLMIVGVTIFSSCISTMNIASTVGLEESDFNGIEKGSEFVYIKAETTPIELHNRIVNVLIKRGHRIAREDKERYYITTEGKDVGASTLQRMSISVTQKDGFSEAKIQSEYKPGQDAVMTATAFSGVAINADWQKATYQIERQGIAYGEALAIAKMVSQSFY